jgi:formylglycine-generating enzyme required for sulfatase activity
LRDSDRDTPAIVSAFSLDRYEVTVGRFRAFVEAGGGTREHPPPEGAGQNPLLPESGWRPEWNDRLPVNRAALEEELGCTDRYRFWTEQRGPHEFRPINCVRWYVAFAFCAWDGGRLPTEAEWTFAAVGGDEQRLYPWGRDEPTPERAAYDCVADGDPTCAFTDVVPVGSLAAGVGRWGQADLAGNVSEWILDSEDPYQVPCSDCASLNDVPTDRVIRGGNFGDPPEYLRTDSRGGLAPTLYSSDIGIRCARSSAPSN